MIASRLGVIAAMPTYRSQDRYFVTASFGRVVDGLAGRFERVYLCTPLSHGSPEASADYRLESNNLDFIPQPFYCTTAGALRHTRRIASAYAQTARSARWVFARGLCPLAPWLYAVVKWHGGDLVHWIVGDPVALLESHRRTTRAWVDRASLGYARLDRMCTLVARRWTNSAFICNGEPLARVYRSPRTFATVSTSITNEDLFVRRDTCGNPTLTLVFVGHVRPEKGLEFLLQAVAAMRIGRVWALDVIGAHDRFDDYQQRLRRLSDELHIADKVRWVGHVPFGERLFSVLRRSDLLVLPSLSEGTPRVLVEARANSLPIIATNVGGIPSSVRDEVDGLLVPPKDVPALTRAIERVVGDPQLRQSLIRNGLAAVRENTVDRFVDLVINVFDRGKRRHDD